MSRLQTALERFIEISGDRTGERGESISTGLAWINGHKLVLVADSGEAHNHNPGSWRRASRIIGLARHLRKPLLLWNLSFHRTTENMRNVGTEHAVQNSEQDLFQFPAPIICVIEGTRLGAFSPVELAIPDGTVFVDGAEALCEYLSISPRTIRAGGDPEIASGISELISDIASIPADELVMQRKARLGSIALA